MNYKELIETINERLTEQEKEDKVGFFSNKTESKTLFLYKDDCVLFLTDKRGVRDLFHQGFSIEDLSLSLNIGVLEVEQIIREGF